MNNHSLNLPNGWEIKKLGDVCKVIAGQSPEGKFYNQEKLLEHSRGATVAHINMKDIRAFKIYDLSSLSKQQIIVQKLDALSAETKKLEGVYRQKIETLDTLKKALLSKAFSGGFVDK